MKAQKYIDVSKATPKGGSSIVTKSVAFMITLMGIFVITATVLINKEKQEKLFERPIVYSLEMVWENDSIQFFDFRKGSYRSELFYDKINKRWFR